MLLRVLNSGAAGTTLNIHVSSISEETRIDGNAGVLYA